MKEDIKKKFLDILFETEDDEEEVVVDEPLKDVKLEEKTTPLKASDLLYNRKQSISFLNIEKKEETKTPEKPRETYNVKPNLSPMFGIVDNLKDDEVEEIVPVEEEKPVNMTGPLKKTHDSYLGTIISPIYGYDVKNDLSNTMNLSIHKVESDYESIEIEEEKPTSYYNKYNDYLEGNKNPFDYEGHPNYIIEEPLEDILEKDDFEELNVEEEPEEVIEEEVVEEDEYAEVEPAMVMNIKEEQPVEEEVIEEEVIEELEETEEVIEEPQEEIEEVIEEEVEEEIPQDEFEEDFLEEAPQEEIVEEEFIEEEPEEVIEETEEIEEVPQEDDLFFEDLSDILSEEEMRNVNDFNTDFVADSIFEEALNEERGFENTEEIDLFEDLFEESED